MVIGSVPEPSPPGSSGPGSVTWWCVHWSEKRQIFRFRLVDPRSDRVGQEPAVSMVTQNLSSLSGSRAEAYPVTRPPLSPGTRLRPSPPAAPWLRPTCRLATPMSNRWPPPSCRTLNPTWPPWRPLQVRSDPGSDESSDDVTGSV